MNATAFQGEEFDPGRFAPGRSSGHPRFACFPCGGGLRQCIGQSMALVEAQLVLATVLGRCRLRPVSDRPVEAEAPRHAPDARRFAHDRRADVTGDERHEIILIGGSPAGSTGTPRLTPGTVPKWFRQRLRDEARTG